MNHNVTQEDRDAAADQFRYLGENMSLMRAGLMDSNSLVQAFARHRQSALTTAQAEIEALRARLAELEGKILMEREENLWNAYNSGHENDGRWTHMFISEAQWLVRQMGLDQTLAYYDADDIKARIPETACQALAGEP